MPLSACHNAGLPASVQHACVLLLLVALLILQLLHVFALQGLRPAVRKAEEEAAKRLQARADVMARKADAPSIVSKEEQREREKKLEEEIDRRVKERDAEEDLWKKYCAEADAMNNEVDALLAQRKALSEKLVRHGTYLGLRVSCMLCPADFIAAKSLCNKRPSGFRHCVIMCVHASSEAAAFPLLFQPSLLLIKMTRFSEIQCCKPHCVLQERLENEMKDLQGPLAEASKENRKFSRDVRDIIQAGDIDRARKMCEAQVRTLPPHSCWQGLGFKLLMIQ